MEVRWKNVGYSPEPYERHLAHLILNAILPFISAIFRWYHIPLDYCDVALSHTLYCDWLTFWTLTMH